MANEKTTIELETLNGNKVYPEIDASRLTGEIAESSTGFIIGGDAYTALSEKANNAEVVHLTGDEAISGIKEFDSKIRQLINSSGNKVYRGTYTLGKPSPSNNKPWDNWKEEYKNTNRKPYRMWTYYAADGLPGDTSTVIKNSFYVAKLTINVSSDYIDEQNPNKRFGTIVALCYLVNDKIRLNYISSTGIGNSFKISWTQGSNVTGKYIRIFSLEPQYDDYIDSIVVDWVSTQFEYSKKSYYFGEYIKFKDFHETDGNDSSAEPFYDAYGSLNTTSKNLLYETFNTIISNPIKSNVYYLTENLDVDLTNGIWWTQVPQDTSIVLVNKTSSSRQVKIYEDTYVTIPAASTDSRPAKRFMYDTKNNRWYAEKLNQANWNTTDETDPSFIIGKPTLYSFGNYNEEDYRADAGKQPQYVYNCHEITQEELTAKKFVVRLPLSKYDEASKIRLMGDIYSIRGLPSLRGSGSAINLKSGHIDSIELVLGDYYGNKLTNEPTIRIIDSTELAKSDINYGYNSLSQCRFHFSHFGSCSSSATKITSTAESLLIIVNLSSTTTLVAGNVFQILVNWIQF